MLFRSQETGALSENLTPHPLSAYAKSKLQMENLAKDYDLDILITRPFNDISILLQAGAAKVSISSAAVQQPDLLKQAVDKFGQSCIVAAIDARKQPTGVYEVYTHGGSKGTGLEVVEWAQKAEALGAGEILLTSMDRDGTRDGYDLELTRLVSEKVNIPVIASGGAGNLEHLWAACTQGRATAVLGASIFHYGEYSIREAKEFLQSKGVAVRL